MYQPIPTARMTNTLRTLTPDDRFTALALTDESQTEVLNLLAERPLHTVALTGFIRDNGLVSPSNRGAFYGVRNDQGRLEGVALIGHATLLETRTRRAIHALAGVAQQCSTTHMILGERERIDEFWSSYEMGGQKMRLTCRELLYELRWPVEVQEVPGLRLATVDELALITPVQNRMVYEESGMSPLERDPEGFSQRCQRRIEQGRTWILVEDGTLLFKADVISDTQEVAYLEGVWVNETGRGMGHGLRCLSQLSKELLQRTKSISLLVDEKNKRAQTLYRKCGFRFRTTYDTIFLERQDTGNLN